MRQRRGARGPESVTRCPHLVSTGSCARQGTARGDTVGPSRAGCTDQAAPRYRELRPDGRLLPDPPPPGGGSGRPSPVDKGPLSAGQEPVGSRRRRRLFPTGFQVARTRAPREGSVFEGFRRPAGRRARSVRGAHAPRPQQPARVGSCPRHLGGLPEGPRRCRRPRGVASARAGRRLRRRPSARWSGPRRGWCGGSTE